MDTGGTADDSVTGVRPPQPAAAAAAAANPPSPHSSTERPSNMAPSGAPGNAKRNRNDKLITSHSMF